MRIARLETPEGPRSAVAVDDRWDFIIDPFAREIIFTGDSTPMDGAVLLAPVQPGLVVGIAHNLTNNNHVLPIQAWQKSAHTVAGPGDEILAQRGVGTVNVEGELAVVIGRSATALTVENAFDYVLGFTVANDVTNVDQVPVDEKNFQSKSGVNYTPLGPWIETEVADPENVSTEVAINGEVRARSGSFNLPSSVAATLAYVTRWLTLEPGDVIMTGAPNTFVAVHPGDRVDITLAGIGTLSSTVG
ncbi:MULTISPECIES: fumarylacetoacetate hydrolase family protein [unclassified Cryobacterium]|uniref:fumarylacetoacetate hydrolase family protein n=1 Tax=unclassified Cryobacterium TaxID=2649013 RepID=UPI002AB39BB7|nr:MULTISPECIES: fumarylacetoacetate hydrolase family protein [unclassified Cryobacterium]MDY7529727.1 fumarylacetoacetate hydrolase family protein [Cryobacterium sp. 10C2]MDY7558145.1 fumarylacetoacetate hydrolase family protein [Cryobacterium sp. 10C3]MEB0202056.1 fumarylacetoacetate hydrolase family protein [Cryobacterium sp. 5I3]MEB0289511.1 fumarylacetoacetate hydrolase family protein [Cryobacterium sp. 10C2]